MVKIISNQCDQNNNPYIALKDILGIIANYDNDGNFEYIQSKNGDQYTIDDLKNMTVSTNIKLMDPLHGNQGNILAENQGTPKSGEIEVKQERGIIGCVNLGGNNSKPGSINIDTTRHGCDIQKIFNTDNAIKINLTGGVELGKEFAQLEGNINLSSKDGGWIDLGLDGHELSNYAIKITNDCNCKPDTEAFQEHRDDIVVKSVKSGEKVGSINTAAWYFRNNDLYYDLPTDKPGPSRVGDNGNYLKVLSCDEQKPYYKLALCDQNGQAIEKTGAGAIIEISKCNFVGEQKIQLKDYLREDSLPSLILKPSTSKELGESHGIHSRAEVYTYDPSSGDVGDKVGKLNATDIGIYNNKEFIAHNFLLADKFDPKYFYIDHNITVKERDGLYDVDKSFFDNNKKPVDAETAKLLLDDLLCLSNQDSLQDGIQIIV